MLIFFEYRNTRAISAASRQVSNHPRKNSLFLQSLFGSLYDDCAELFGRLHRLLKLCKTRSHLSTYHRQSGVQCIEHMTCRSRRCKLVWILFICETKQWQKSSNISQYILIYQCLYFTDRFWRLGSDTLAF